MNHESRIKKLEKEVIWLKQVLVSSGLLDEFIPLSQASTRLKVNPWVIKDRIRNDSRVELGKHYCRNGNRYLVNVEQWQNLIAADEQAKR